MRLYSNIPTIADVLFGVAAAGQAQVITPFTDLPPDGVYISPSMYHEHSAIGIILDDPANRPFVGTAIREADGLDELETLGSEFTATEIGLGLGPMTLADRYRGAPATGYSARRGHSLPRSSP